MYSIAIIKLFLVKDKKVVNCYGKAKFKQSQETVLENIAILSLTRAAFIVECLRAHDLHDSFSPGVEHGPSIKMWWTGSA